MPVYVLYKLKSKAHNINVCKISAMQPSDSDIFINGNENWKQSNKMLYFN